MPGRALGRDQGGEPRPADSISGSTGLKMPRAIISATVGAGSGKAEQLQQLVGDPLARQRHQVVGARRAGLERRRVRRALAEAGVEAEEAQDAQMILGDALQRLADEAHPARLQIVDAAEIVEQLAARPDRRRAR